jgi:hypothetical protein
LCNGQRMKFSEQEIFWKFAFPEWRNKSPEIKISSNTKIRFTIHKHACFLIFLTLA